MVSTPAATGEKSATQGLVDPAEWAVLKTIPVNLGGHITNATAILLRSVKSKGESGTGTPLFADMLILSGGKFVYQFHQPGICSEFFIDDTLEAKDVTGDGIPEVLFHSGSVGASDFSTYEHVIYHAPDEPLDEGSAPFPALYPRIDWVVDVAAYAAVPFVRTRRQTFRWLDFRGVTLALIANPLLPASGDDPHSCHACPRFYQYLVFRWENDKRSFVLSRSIQSQRVFEEETDPLQTDLPFILERLRNKCQ
jgi:hypothetical protein